MTEIQWLAKRMVDVTEFFGCSLNEVNVIILRIGMKHRPEWLRNCPKLEKLPRWGDVDHYCVEHPRRLTPSEVGDRVVWIVEELRSEWKLTTTGFHFQEPVDAIHYKLMWS